MTGSTPVEGIPWLDASRGYTMARRQSRAYHGSTPVEGIPWLDASRGSWRACCAYHGLTPVTVAARGGPAVHLNWCSLVPVCGKRAMRWALPAASSHMLRVKYLVRPARRLLLVYQPLAASFHNRYLCWLASTWQAGAGYSRVPFVTPLNPALPVACWGYRNASGTHNP